MTETKTNKFIQNDPLSLLSGHFFIVCYQCSSAVIALTADKTQGTTTILFKPHSHCVSYNAAISCVVERRTTFPLFIFMCMQTKWRKF